MTCACFMEIRCGLQYLRFVVFLIFIKSSATNSPNLASLLQSLEFKNEGIVNSTDNYVWKTQPCSYLEPWNVTTIQRNWLTAPTHNYLYQRLGDGTLVPPPSGMRSAVPLGGISTGSIELRADGKLHEWTIMNQSPASAAKIQVFEEAMFIVSTGIIPRSATDPDSTLRFQSHPTDGLEGDIQYETFILQTHPEDNTLPGVKSLRYYGAHPVSRLDVLDDRIPVDISLYGYSTYKVGDMETSATPAIAFTFIIKNPSTTNTVSVKLMLTLPVGAEKMTERTFAETGDMEQSDDLSYKQKQSLMEMRLKKDEKNKEKPVNIMAIQSYEDCFDLCNSATWCETWMYNIINNACTLFKTTNLNMFNSHTVSGLKGYWTPDQIDNATMCNTMVRPGHLGPHGNISICTKTNGDPDQKVSSGVSNNLKDLLKKFTDRDFSPPPVGEKNYNIHGEVDMTLTIPPGQTKDTTFVMSWFYPNRDFVGSIKGNYYAHLFKDSLDVNTKMADNLANIVTDISKLHQSFYSSSLPDFLQDMYINSLSHIRSAMWFGNGLWRQWEANDCTNMDSVHNDGERHIPYIMFFPNSTRNKMYGWAQSQLENYMIPEQLRCTPSGPSSNIDVPCGRVMSDVSSMFIVYLLEMYKWAGDKKLLNALWQNAMKAAIWHINVSQEYGIPFRLQNTYDVLGLNAYSFATYNSAFHLLAMRAAEELALIQGDKDFAALCHEAFLRGQSAMDKYQWNMEGSYYDAYTKLPGDALYQEHGDWLYAKNHWFKRPLMPEANEGAIMTDSFYAQVLAYSLGLGPLINETRLAMHMKAELERNDSPYGMLVMTGRYPYPGPWQDNAVWMMGNPNWASISLNLGHDPDHCLQVAQKSLDIWRSELHDQWNVAGILGGLGYGAEGQPYITSHYGYFMSSWHIVLALSGQQADIPNGRLTFSPKIKGDNLTVPVLLPGILGTLSSIITGNDVQHTLQLQFGDLTLNYLAVGDSVYPSKTITIRTGQKLTWS